MKNTVWALLCLFVLVGCDQKQEEGSRAAPEPAEVTDPSKIAVSGGGEADGSASAADQFVTYNLEGERIVRLSPDGEDNATTRQIGAVVTIKNQYDGLSAEMLKKKLSQNFIRKCSACHNHYANGIIGPSLLTKSEKEISDMIASYRSGTKKNVLMVQLVRQMDDKEIHALAKEIAEFNKEVREKK